MFFLFRDGWSDGWLVGRWIDEYQAKHLFPLNHGAEGACGVLRGGKPQSFNHHLDELSGSGARENIRARFSVIY